MKRARNVVVIVVVVGVIVAAGALALRFLGSRQAQASQAGFEPAEAVEILEAREVEWQPTADLVGTVFALRSVTVRNELDGVVRFVGFDSGQVVEEGQVLIRQDDSAEQADLEAARAAVRVAEANLVQADAHGAVAEVDLDRARTRVETARADRGRWAAEADQARARVAQVEARIAKLTIRAPFRGRAGIRTVHEGQYLAAGTDIVVLQELADRIYLDFAVPQEFIDRVHVGTIVMGSGPLLGPEPVPIVVAAMDAAVSRDTRNIRVRGLVDNPRGLLLPGMSVQVRVPVEEARRVVCIPATAIRRAAYGNSVFLVLPDESGQGLRARQRFVTLGPSLGDDVIVLDGLKPGDRFAAAGSFKLRDGVKVMTGPPPGGPPGVDPNSPPPPGTPPTEPSPR